MPPDQRRDDRDDWFAGYVGRVSQLVADAGQVNAQVAEQWGARSLGGDDWTVDTITADVIETWEHLTPLAERSLELWLELVQRAIRPGQP
ncbi:MAG: hypothetical protein ACRDZN_09900 [Acidimicrobiales bacterium]